jgi:threonine aldolase
MFGSDNQAPAHLAVLEAVVAANEGRAGSYGDDDWSKRALEQVQRVFETQDLDLYFVGTGGAANGLALSVLCPPWGAVLAHGSAHVIGDEGSGPEHFTSGARMVGIGHDTIKLSSESLAFAAQQFQRANVHGLQVRAVTLTNLSENGLAYSVDQVAAIGEICRSNGWGLHMDGARFANAVVSSKATAAELTWRNGVDALSFGLTKNGAINAEALILFGKARGDAAPYLRKRAGHLFSKQRYLAAQFVAMLENDSWLDLAARANDSASALAAVLGEAGCQVIYDVQGNEVFARLSGLQAAALQSAEIGFYPWAPAGAGAYRFVTSWQTVGGDIEKVKQTLARV